ncbi:LacI family DNA-binding transcriptional regulator [Ktedonobacter racemifer]|uniref:Transcriptional regulator, LacI family n=1 Tax=Ktedonobacter racemifer DSM 44963 TaxID=485913 RepID=D6TT22_KTERA|nr:LacI family DNA-binding transcriptional regulator [Ktedonobacter racemifer]EFH83573.1 transcriptional regulator, LacI family [Ktedonobacter racemifer DSM 44963]
MVSEPDKQFFDLSPQPRQNVTLRDVADAAGVTLGTASKAINGRGRLSPETRERVRSEARRLGFRFFSLQEDVPASQGVMVGVLTTDNYGRFSLPLLMGIEDAFGTRPVSAMLCNSRDQSREQQHLQHLLARKVDGIVVSARREDSRPPINIGRTVIPVVYAFTYVEDPNALCVLPDDAQGARLATEHLVSLGRRQFAHITGPSYFEAVRLREGAMRQVLAEHDIALPHNRVLSGPWQESWGYTATNFLFDQDPSIDALFCGSDQLARGAMEALQARGLRVPTDVSVVGFDNWEPMACATRPPLTTVDMNLAQVGRYVGESLLALFAGEQRSGIVRLPCSLILRGSSDPSQSG